SFSGVWMLEFGCYSLSVTLRTALLNLVCVPYSRQGWSRPARAGAQWRAFEKNSERSFSHMRDFGFLWLAPLTRAPQNTSPSDDRHRFQFLHRGASKEGLPACRLFQQLSPRIWSVQCVTRLRVRIPEVAGGPNQ